MTKAQTTLGVTFGVQAERNSADGKDFNTVFGVTLDFLNKITLLYKFRLLSGHKSGWGGAWESYMYIRDKNLRRGHTAYDAS